MAGELKLNNVSVATESGGTVTVGNSNVSLSTGVSNLGGMFLLSSSSSNSSVSSIDFNNILITSTYKTYVIHIDRIAPVNDADELSIKFSSDNLSSFLNVTTGRLYSQQGSSNSGNEHETNVDYFQLATDLGNDAKLGASSEISIYNSQDANLSDRAGAKAVTFGKHGNFAYNWWAGCSITCTGVMNGFRINYAGGAIGFHSVRLYGLK